jgi:pimeloyl-ACP methyl ester carboxylesterase
MVRPHILRPLLRQPLRLAPSSSSSSAATPFRPAQFRLAAPARAYTSGSSGGSSSSPFLGLDTDDTVELAYDHHAPPAGRERFSETTAPIVFMHGLFGSRKNNRTASRVLARELGRHVYAVDLRNHGASPHRATHTYGAMAGDVARFVADRGFADATLIGHSMGAKVAMAVALAEPPEISTVADMVAVDNAPLDAALSGDFGRYVRAMRRIDDARVTRQADADKILAEVEPELPIRQFLLGNLHRPQGETALRFRIPVDILGGALHHMADFPYKNPDEVRFERPALFVRGTKSKYVPDEVIPLIGQFFPRFQMVDIDAGHWVISEKPEEFLKGESTRPCCEYPSLAMFCDFK